MPMSSFGPDRAWTESLGQVRDVVRQRLVTAQLLDHLPAPVEGQLIVDVGCGQGTQVVALAEQGYQIVGVDPSPELLDRARDALAARSPEVQARVTLEQGNLETLGDVVLEPVAIVLCHGVLMYLQSLSDSLASLARHLAEGGILSVLTRNQAGIAMRAGMERRWSDAVEGFGARHYTNNLGMEGVRADSPGEVIAACQALGLEVLSWYGVRLFTDHWQSHEMPEAIETLIDAEREAGARDPYRGLAALTHVLASKPA